MSGSVSRQLANGMLEGSGGGVGGCDGLKNKTKHFFFPKTFKPLLPISVHGLSRYSISDCSF
jgi:hypothetical protein